MPKETRKSQIYGISQSSRKLKARPNACRHCAQYREHIVVKYNLLPFWSPNDLQLEFLQDPQLQFPSGVIRVTRWGESGWGEIQPRHSSVHPSTFQKLKQCSTQVELYRAMLRKIKYLADGDEKKISIKNIHIFRPTLDTIEITAFDDFLGTVPQHMSSTSQSNS